MGKDDGIPLALEGADALGQRLEALRELMRHGTTIPVVTLEGLLVAGLLQRRARVGLHQVPPLPGRSASSGYDSATPYELASTSDLHLVWQFLCPLTR